MRHRLCWPLNGVSHVLAGGLRLLSTMPMYSTYVSFYVELSSEEQDED